MSPKSTRNPTLPILTNPNPLPYVDRPGLFTDLYELTMMQGFFYKGLHEQSAGFDYFFRKIPFDGGFVVFAGLQDLLDTLHGLHFTQQELDFLASRGFRPEFLKYLKGFEFRGTVFAAKEGDVIFPSTPVVRVTGRLLEVQLIETLLLNLLNFQSLIATKAARMRLAAGPEKSLIDFGLRRAQGLGGIHATRAAMIGGFDATSNVHAAMRYDVQAVGTMAHSWVQSFGSELEAFRAFVELYPEGSVLLVDTYDTLGSGVPNAIKVAKELEATGGRLKGIRLDSGDLAYFSRKARAMLDAAGLNHVRITVSNQLDERLIRSLLSQGAPIASFGVGTRLVTGVPDAALDGVYKQCLVGGRASMKVSENVEKVTLPGLKRVWRMQGEDGYFAGDAIGLDGDGFGEASGSADAKGIAGVKDFSKLETTEPPTRMHHPIFPAKKTDLTKFTAEELLRPVMVNGEPVVEEHDLKAMAAFSAGRIASLAPEHLRFDNPHVYKVGVTPEVLELRDTLLKNPG